MSKNYALFLSGRFQHWKLEKSLSFALDVVGREQGWVDNFLVLRGLLKATLIKLHLCLKDYLKPEFFPTLTLSKKSLRLWFCPSARVISDQSCWLKIQSFFFNFSIDFPKSLKSKKCQLKIFSNRQKIQLIDCHNCC